MSSFVQDTFPTFVESPPNLTDLTGFYKQSKKRFDSEEEFKLRAQREVGGLATHGERA